MKALNIVETAYRATIEKQDDTVIWFTHAMRGAGAELAVLLRSNAVCYAADGQDSAGCASAPGSSPSPRALTATSPA